MSFTTQVPGDTTMIGVVTHAEEASMLTVTYQSVTLIDNKPIPAGRHAQAVDMGLFAIPETDDITVSGVADTEFKGTVSGV